MSARLKPREEDSASIISRVSGLLSMGGATNFTVKSSFMDNMSVQTPRSKYVKSQHSSQATSRSQKVTWTQYRGHSKVKAQSPDRIFMSTGYNTHQNE